MEGDASSIGGNGTGETGPGAGTAETGTGSGGTGTGSGGTGTGTAETGTGSGETGSGGTGAGSGGGCDGSGEVVSLEPRPFRPFKSSEEYLIAMKEDLAEWLQRLYPHLNIDADNFVDVLEDGIVLCKVT